jgi:hypothetical protein
MSTKLLLYLALAASFLIGCSNSSETPTDKSDSSQMASLPSPPAAPPEAEVDKGVNWALSAQIPWNHKEKELFLKYTIVNKYAENRGEWRAYVYDFEADCPVFKLTRWYDRSASTTIVWNQPELDGTSGAWRVPITTNRFVGTFTLIKKGEIWYPYETVR